MNELENLSIRFFAWVNELDNDGYLLCNDIMEVSESDFIEASAAYGCTYERHTVRENGCAQVILNAKNECHPIER